VNVRVVYFSWRKKSKKSEILGAAGEGMGSCRT